jgi:type I restriction enzyme, S subunit
MKSETKNNPALRFPEFTHDWSEDDLGNLAEVTTGNKDTQDSAVNGEYPFFVRSQTVERINTFSYDGEAVLTSGDGVGVGKNFHYINGKFDFHQRVYCLRNFANALSGKFLFFYFSKKFNRRVMRLSAKNSVDSVRRDMIVKMPIMFPSRSEQEKIAAFLSAVDEKIRQLVRKKDLLLKYKKGVMHQIFDQKIRFKKIDGDDFPDWEETKLGLIGSFRSGVGFGEAAQGGLWGIPFYKVSDMNLAGNEFYMTKANNYVTPDQIKTYKYNPIHEPSILFAKVGAAIFLERKRIAQDFLIDNNMMAFTPEGNVIFIKYLFDMIRLSRFAQVGALPSFNSSDMRIIKVGVPTAEEQTKIADFLSAIDKKLYFVQKQLEVAHAFQKGLLQQMLL